jgi:restriction endonuclease Mrr
MSISQLVPREDAELALHEEMWKEGKPIKTSELVARAIKHFPQPTPAELQRRTPSGTLFWPGRFRFDLNNLKKKGQASSPMRGYWEITSSGIQRLTGKSQSPTHLLQSLAATDKKIIKLLYDTARAIQRGEVAAEITMKEGEFTIKIGKDIRHTTVGVVNSHRKRCSTSQVGH